MLTSLRKESTAFLTYKIAWLVSLEHPKETRFLLTRQLQALETTNCRANLGITLQKMPSKSQRQEHNSISRRIETTNRTKWTHTRNNDRKYPIFFIYSWVIDRVNQHLITLHLIYKLISCISDTLQKYVHWRIERHGMSGMWESLLRLSNARSYLKMQKLSCHHPQASAEPWQDCASRPH